MLVVNAGSSTLKLALVGDGDEALAVCELEATGGFVRDDELRDALAGELSGAEAVGHRVVHGGERFRQAVRIDREVRAALRELCDLAPLHQAKALAALDTVSEALPDVPAVACFDTAFHATLEPAASTYALPRRWRERWPIRRFGFHGLSHAWIAQRAASLVGEDARVVSAHLGSGASLCAIRAGRSVDTTMGFTPLEGLVMATRSGSVDPGLLMWLLEHGGMSPAELARALEHESGLLGLSGTADMREVLERAGAAQADAVLAIAVYVHRLRAGIGAMAASLGGLDALVFTGGVGERSAEVRGRVVEGLAFLGLVIDPNRNLAAAGDSEVSGAGAMARTFVVRAREDLEIARQVRAAV